MSTPDPERRPTTTFPSVAYLLGTGVVAAVGLGLAFAAVVVPIVGVVSMLPLLVGLQAIGVRKRAERQERRAPRPGGGGLG